MNLEVLNTKKRLQEVARAGTYDLILVGSSFASSFFLLRYLERAPADSRILILERGMYRPSLLDPDGTSKTIEADAEKTFHARGGKPWVYTPAVGGGSNCWWACTPRMVPSDFETLTRFGQGQDWPLSYEDLEPYYCQAERVMSVSGEGSFHYPRSEPFPQPPHRLSSIDQELRQALGDALITQPSARARRATQNRPACCANGICRNCPINSKFTIINELGEILFLDPRVTFLTGAEVLQVERSGGLATGVVTKVNEEIETVHCSLIGLGANALFNPAILIASGYTHPRIGQGIGEQRSVRYVLDLGRGRNFDGSTSISAHILTHLDREDRSKRAGCLIESMNVPLPRLEEGRWSERLVLNLIFEEHPQLENTVRVPKRSESTGSIPEVDFTGYSSYLQAGMSLGDEIVEHVTSSLPVERIVSKTFSNTESHILSTVPMGKDSNAPLDLNLRLKEADNILVLGGSSFPSIPAANPTLTLSALSLRAADKVFERGGVK